MAFGIMYGFVCGCFLSLSPAVAAQLYGSGRLAGLSGLLLLFNLPGMCLYLIPACAALTLCASTQGILLEHHWAARSSPQRAVTGSPSPFIPAPCRLWVVSCYYMVRPALPVFSCRPLY